MGALLAGQASQSSPATRWQLREVACQMLVGYGDLILARTEYESVEWACYEELIGGYLNAHSH